MAGLKDAGAVLAGARIALGASIWAAPKQAARIITLSPDSDPDGLTVYVARIAGVRDVALGAGMLMAPSKHKRLWLIAGGACDGADLAAGLLAGVTGRLSRRSTVLVSLAAAGGVLFSLVALSADRNGVSPCSASPTGS